MMGIQVSYKTKKPASIISLTSLMDVLTIILVFMLVNYSEEPTKSIPQFVSLPTISAASSDPAGIGFKDATPVVISSDRIVIGENTIHFLSIGRERIQVQNEIEILLKAVRTKYIENGKFFPIAIQADQNISFEILDVFLSSAAKTGFTNLRLVARQGRGT